VPHPLSTFKDCEDCPEMVALPAGEFMMGSPESEFQRLETGGPPRRVAIARRFAIGRFEITMDQFSAFVAQTGMAVGDQCRKIVEFSGSSAGWGAPEASFRQPGFEVTGKHPVVCVSWHDAQAYVAWLSRRTGKAYRLPSEAEWEYAARAGTRTRYSFGNDPAEMCAYAKFADLASRFGWRGGCRSDMATYGTKPQAQPVGTFRRPRQRMGMGRGLLDTECDGNPDRRIRIRSPRMRNRRHSRGQLGRRVWEIALGKPVANAGSGALSARRFSGGPLAVIARGGFLLERITIISQHAGRR
jgi:formylglycine-generating enzyme required for sulfatase activity